MVAERGRRGGRDQCRTARAWLARYRAEGRDGLLDRSSAPRTVANRTDDRRIEVIAALRRLRMTGAEIAETLDMALSTVSGILTRIGLGRLGRLGLEPAQRYELIHIDVKKLGRIARPGHRVRAASAAAGTTAADTSTAESSCTSASTTPPAWPTSRFSMTNER